MSSAFIRYGAMLLVALIASVTDLKSGLIPNRLTLPVVALSPVLGAALGGMRGFLGALLGIIICGLVPFVFHRLGAMGGGDVKLFAALGGLAGPSMGLEIELLSLSCAFFFGLALLAYRGRLLRSLYTSGRLALNAFLPESRRSAVEREELTTLRIGAAIFFGTVLAVLDRTWLGMLLS